MLILRNANVACLCLLFIPMLNVEFKKRLSHVTIILTPRLMSLGPMSHAELKKTACRPVNFRGHGHFSKTDFLLPLHEPAIESLVLR